jgi:hypothetical protein
MREVLKREEREGSLVPVKATCSRRLPCRQRLDLVIVVVATRSDDNKRFVGNVVGGVVVAAVVEKARIVLQ